MKKTNKQFTLIVALGLVAFAASNLQAQAVQTVTITATAFVQNNNTTDNGTSTTTPPPIKKSITTKVLLQQLAQDEFTAGNWPSNGFPAGATLVLVNPLNGDFQVVKGTNLLLAVSNVLSIQYPGVNDISTGKYTDANGPLLPPFTQTHYLLTTLTYDSTNIGGTTRFALTGLGVWTTTASAPNPTTGIYTETISFSGQNGTGEGIAPDGTPFVLTGTASAKGTGKLGP